MAHAPTPTALELFTREQLDEFLRLIRTGVGRHLAASRIGGTGRLMKSLARPQRDPEFAAEYEEAWAEGRAFYEDRLAAESRSRGLDGSDRMLEVELATHHPDYRHLRRDRMQVNGNVKHEHALTISLDPAILDTWPVEKLQAFRAHLAELQGEVVEGEAHELPAGSPESDSQPT